MFRAGRLANAVMLATGIMLASAAFVLAEAAASQSRSPDLVSATLVLRGSTDAPEHEAATADGSAPSVLRGSRPSVAQPRAAPYACPPGLEYDPNYGCVWSGFSYSPDYGYWPDFGYWPYGLGTFDDGWRRGSRHGFAHANRRGRVFRLGRRFLGGFGDGFPHAAGLGHGFAQAAHFGH
jgi:hypothetical protein